MKLLGLMQENLLVFNVWLEKRFKNYHYLSKAHRREMYSNAEIIAADFEKFAASHAVTEQMLKSKLSIHGLSFDPADLPKLKYFAAIMAYFDPHGRFKYQEGTSFGRLLINPLKEKMIGDCNQIVTLYAYLYSKKFLIRDLQIKLPTGHVCLHFKGIDIEATSGAFKNYKEYEYIAPITELISTNLLDINDPREATSTIDAETFVKSAQLAYTISSRREIVEKNLQVAYRNLGVEAMRQKDFDKAEFYLGKCTDKRALEAARHNAAVYYLNRKNFSKAHYYADKMRDNEKLKRAIYAGEYNVLVEKVKYVKTMEDARKHRSTYEQMVVLARKMGNPVRAQEISEMISKM